MNIDLLNTPHWPGRVSADDMMIGQRGDGEWFLFKKTPFVDPETGVELERKEGEEGDYFWDPVLGFPAAVAQALHSDQHKELLRFMANALNVGQDHGFEKGRRDMQWRFNKLLGNEGGTTK